MKKVEILEACPLFFYFSQSECRSFFLFSFLCTSFVETTFNLKLNTPLTKYTVTLNFTHTIYHIMVTLYRSYIQLIAHYEPNITDRIIL